MTDKMAWMLAELNADNFYPSEKGVNDILDGNSHEFFDESLIDYVEELDKEWEAENSS
jgi:hypothetical protein